MRSEIASVLETRKEYFFEHVQGVEDEWAAYVENVKGSAWYV